VDDDPPVDEDDPPVDEDDPVDEEPPVEEDPDEDEEAVILKGVADRSLLPKFPRFQIFSAVAKIE